MATETLKLTADIIISHASMTELSTKELVEEIKTVYNYQLSIKIKTLLLSIFELPTLLCRFSRAFFKSFLFSKPLNHSLAQYCL